MSARYARAMDECVLRSLLQDGPYRFLISDVSVGDPDALDVHLRENNTIMYYHGTTRVLTVQFRAGNGSVKAKASADPAYARYSGCQQEYHRLMTQWVSEDADAFRSAFLEYLPKAITSSNARYYRNQQEGYWQNRLCIRYGKQWSPADEWLIIDRECVVGFDDGSEKARFYENASRAYQGVRDRLQREDAVMWGKPAGKTFGDELDMLAINQAGDLVVIELKHGKNSRGIYWGPLQVGLYHDAFATTTGAISDGIRKLVAQKIALGLLPHNACGLLDRSSLKRVEPMLAVAKPNRDSNCWRMMALVIAEIDRAGIQRPSLPLRIARIGAEDDDLKIDFTPAF